MPGQVAQMFEQALDALKGWFHLAALDKSAKLSSSLLGSTTVPAGRCAAIDDNGEFIINVCLANAAAITKYWSAMPIFLWNGSNHPDVYNDGVSSVSGTQHWIGISPTGIMSGLVATGGYELQTTEFDDNQTYLPNDLLSAMNQTDGDAAADYGKLTNQNAAPGTNRIVGVASWHVQGTADGLEPAGAEATSPVGYNAHGVSTLSFWSYFLPADEPVA